MGKTSLKTVVSAAAVLILGCVYLIHPNKTAEDEITFFYDSEEEILSSEAEGTASETFLYVHVSGEVRNPGVYRLQEGQRVCDAISSAGGLTKNADGDRLNQASLLSDGIQIYVPSKKEASLENPEAATSSDIVNINTASKEELLSLPGIGDAKAEAILSYRKRNGPFSCIEDLLNVSGIGNGIFQNIKDKIRI